MKKYYDVGAPQTGGGQKPAEVKKPEAPAKKAVLSTGFESSTSTGSNEKSHDEATKAKEVKK